MGSGASPRRRLGDVAEEAALAHLVRAGYVLLARNFLCRWGELDLVMERRGIVCFVEVRMRSVGVWGDPSQTITWAKQRRVVKAALHFLQAHRLVGKMLRFDVVSVVGQGEDASVEHIPNAFDAGL